MICCISDSIAPTKLSTELSKAGLINRPANTQRTDMWLVLNDQLQPSIQLDHWTPNPDLPYYSLVVTYSCLIPLDMRTSQIKQIDWTTSEAPAQRKLNIAYSSSRNYGKKPADTPLSDLHIKDKSLERRLLALINEVKKSQEPGSCPKGGD